MTIEDIHITYNQTGASQQANDNGMRVMQARAFEKREAQYLLIKSPPASGKSRALMFIALDKLHRQGWRKPSSVSLKNPLASRSAIRT